MLTQERLKELLYYSPETGVFIWRSHEEPTNVKIAGCVKRDGYWDIKIAKKAYKAHRLVWLWVYGCWPDGSLDHINGNKTDNRISNLRCVTSRQNMQNLFSHRNGKLVGCRFHKRAQKWEGRIKIAGKHLYLGLFPTELEANEAYCAKHLELFGTLPIAIG